MHDATKMKLGATYWSGRDVSNEPGDPTTFVAGLAVRRADDGTLQLASDDVAALIGISLGRPLCGTTGRTAVARTGLGVPLLMKAYQASGVVTISNYTNAQGDKVTIGEVEFTGQSGAATPGDATFQAATSLAATATSLAAQINAHPDLDGVVTAEADSATVIVTAVDAGPDGNDIVFTWTDVSTSGGSVSGSGTLAGGTFGAVTHGAAVYVNDEGKGCKSTDDDASATGGTYSGDLLTGVTEAGGEAYCALVDMVGGL